jgi:hypothetical protein
MKNAIFIPKQKKMLHEKSKKSAYWKGIAAILLFHKTIEYADITPP